MDRRLTPAKVIGWSLATILATIAAGFILTLVGVAVEVFR